MEQGVSSIAKNGKNRRGRLKEFLRVEEIGSHVNRVKGTLENIVFRGMEESEKEIRAKRMWFSMFALILLIGLGVTISRHAQSEVAIFHPSACLGGWMEIDKATGPPETASGAIFSNANSAILPENTVADMFCGEFKGEIPEDTQPKVLVLRVAWSIDGSTSTQVIEGESFASSTIEILDAPASTSPDFMLVEPQPATSTEEAPSASTTEEQSDALPATQAIQNEETSSTSSEVVVPAEPVPPTEPQAPPVEDPQSTGFRKNTISLLKKLFAHAYAQETPIEESTTTPLITEVPIEITPAETMEAVQEPSVLGSPIDTPPIEITETVQEPSALESPIDTPTNQGEETITQNIATTSEVLELATSTATSTDSEIASTTASSTEEVSHESPLFDILYSFDGTTWETLGSVTLEQLPATQFEIPLKEESSWGELSKLQIHIRRNPVIDIAPTIFLDAITLEVEVKRIPHEEPTHPDFERDIIVRDITENGVRIVTIVNADTQQEETWYMYLDEEALATTTSEFASTTDSFVATTTASSTGAEEVSASTTDIIDMLAASSTETGTTTEPRLPQMKEKNVWKRYNGTSTLVTFAEIAEQESIPSLEEAASSTEVVEEEIILDLLPDLAADKIRRIKGVFLNSIIIQVIGKTKDELWLYNAESETKERIEAGTSTSVSAEYPFGIKGGFIFWMSNDRSIAYAYNPNTKVFLEQTVPPFDASLGERAEVSFPDISWKVIVNNDKFTFYSQETGEVFSDEDSNVQETLRRKFNLDTILTAEKLNQLDFSVEKQGAEDQ